MIIGDPLIDQPRRVTPPGVRHHNPAHRTASKLILIVIATCVAAWVGQWLMRDPMPTCIDPPYGANYHGWDDSWWYEGHVIGHSVTEDATCIRPG